MPRIDDLTFRRNQRALSSRSEKIIWACLRDRRFMGLKFRRQHSLGAYVADFYCDALKLVIEADGIVHQTDEARSHDSSRDNWLQSEGYRIVRLSDDEILTAVSISLKRVEAVVLNLRE